MSSPGSAPAQRTASPALIGLERKMARDIPELDNRMRQQMADTTEAMNQAYAAAVQGGDATVIREMSRERARWFSGLVQARLAAAEQRAFEETAGMRPTTARGEAGASTRSILDEALGDARAAERELWGEVPRDLSVGVENTLLANEASAEYILDVEALPTPIQQFLDQAATDPTGITSGDLLRFRSRALAAQRNIRSSASPDWTMHRALGEMANGALDDMAGLQGSEAARAFSYQLNNLFSRGEVGKVLRMAPEGGPRITPEMTLERTMGGSRTQAAVASRDLERAASLEGL